MRELVEQNKILHVVTGSHLYGTNVPTSDEDYVGLFIAPQKFYLGLSQVNEVDLSIVSKLESGKNASDAVDSKFYELRKFMKLAMENNPNIIEILFSTESTILFSDVLGARLLKYAEMFPWKGCAEKFLGYAFSQKKKMLVKPENLKALVDAKEYLENYIWHDAVRSVGAPISLLQGSGTPNFIKFSESFCTIGDLNFNLGCKMGDVFASVTTRIEKASHRADGFLEKGYDTKFGMHLIRLMLEGRELLTTGRLEFPVKERDLLLDIRKGNWTKEEIIKFADEIEEEVESLKAHSKLPSKPRYDEIEKMLMDMVKEHWETHE